MAASPLVRRIVKIGLPIVLSAAALMCVMPAGSNLREVQVVRQWIEAQPAVAPLLFIAIYCVAAMLALPVWWLQVIAGASFGLVMGLVWCHIAAIISAAVSMRLAHWLVGEWLQRRIEPYRQRLGDMNESLGHNGLLVVTAARFSTIMPFGITNYLFGLTRIHLTDVVVGTILGGTLTKMIYVGMGVDPHLLGSPRYLLALGVINCLLLSPLLLRYLRPAWFRQLSLD